MKKLPLVAFAVLITTLAGAQIQFGAKAGLNLANWAMSPKEQGISTSLKPFFNAGGLAYIPLFNKFGLQPEVVYSGEGTKIKDVDGSSTYNLGYINVPVLFKYKDASGFFAEIGPQIGFLLNAKAKYGDISVDQKDYLKSTDFSGVIGLGYLSSFNIGVDARYNLGLTNIVKESDNGSIKNGVIQVGLFYMFGGKAK
jgi:hypothetical protein